MTQKVTLHPQAAPMAAAPSQQAVAHAANEVSVLDSAGRTILLRKPNPLAKLRFIDAMGESSANRLWAGTVWPLMFVVSIDGQTVPPPAQKSQIEALYQRLDEHGYEAVEKAHGEHFATDASTINEDLAKK